MNDNRLPRERARETTEPVIYYTLFWKNYYQGKRALSGTREIRMDSSACNLATYDIFGLDPNPAEFEAVGEAFHWIPVKQAWALTQWLIENKPESHERFKWLKERAAENSAMSEE